MNWLFIVDLIILILGFGGLAIGIFMASDHDLKGPTRTTGIVIIVIGGAVLILASLTSVPAQSVGVVTSFGKPVDNYGPGLHLKAPWKRVQDMDGKVQIDDNLAEHRTEIRLANGSNAYVQNALRWKIKQDAAEQLWADYREFDRISTGLVDQELADALNVTFASYDPISAAQATNPEGYDKIAEAVKQRLIARIGGSIEIINVIIPKVDFDEATQRRIDAYQQEKVNTRIAEQRKLTSLADAQANKNLEANVTTNVLVSRCLDLVAKAPAGTLPPTFSCWPGGSNTPVILDK